MLGDLIKLWCGVVFQGPSVPVRQTLNVSANQEIWDNSILCGNSSNMTDMVHEDMDEGGEAVKGAPMLK